MTEWIEPSETQSAQVIIVQHEAIELINRLHKEGIDSRIILAGLGSASADLITSRFGLLAVPDWFEMQAKITRALLAQG